MLHERVSIADIITDIEDLVADLMAFSTQTSVKLHYIFSKPMSPKQPKYYVLIHGLFFGNLASWYPFFTQVLSQENYVLCYDLRGHGLSEAPQQGYRLEDHLDDLEHLLSELNLADQNLCFVGHSYGARLALAMLKARQKQLGRHKPTGHKPTQDRMCLIDPPLLMANQEDQEFLEQLKNTNINDLKSHLPNSLALLLTKEGRRLKKMLKRWTYLLQETQFLKELESLGDIDLEEITLINRFGRVLFGSESGCYKAFPLLKERLSLDIHQDLSQYTEPHQLQVIQGGGHFLLNQSPQQVLDFIISAPKQISQLSQTETRG